MIFRIATICLLITAQFSGPAVFAQSALRERVRERLATRTARSFKGGAEFASIAGLKVAIWRSSAKKGPVPVVIFSHGFRGMHVQSADLMAALARAGYMVFAPNHKDALGVGKGKSTGGPQQPLGRPDKWTSATHKDRGDDITRLVKALKADPRYKGKLDWSKLALVGHSLGGYTALALSGAWPSWKLQGVKAVIALSPYSQPFNRNGAQGGALAQLGVPVMYQTGTDDLGIAPFLKGLGGSFASTSSPAYLVEFDGANHFTWTNLNKHESKEQLIEYYCINFLDKVIKGDANAHPERIQEGVTMLLVK